jgi:hypothetical protein
MQPFANMNLRVRGTRVIFHKFSMTPKRIREQLASELNKEGEERNIGTIEHLKELLKWFRR